MEKTVRVLNWNIKQGGGPRIPDICSHIADVAPDLLVLSEFQTQNEELLRSELAPLGYSYILTSQPSPSRNGLLVASKWPLVEVSVRSDADVDNERWLAVRIAEINMEILAVHVPGAPDNKFEEGYGISGARRKELMWERILRWAADHRDGDAMVIGDLNTGLRIDAEGAMFKKSHYMRQLIDIGFIDVWRECHPNVRDYTWFSRRKDKQTGKTEDLNGFRLDYIFVSPGLQYSITGVAILNAPRRAGFSDHASVAMSIILYPEPKHLSPQPTVESVTAQLDRVSRAGGRHAVDRWSGQAVASDVAELGSQRTRSERSSPALSAGREITPRVVSASANRIRIELPSGFLPDMRCGVNGEPFTQWFRPTYVTAEWSGNAVREVRIWGPRVLQSGELGARELDHRWKSNIAAGGVDFDDLPQPVAMLIRANTASHPVSHRDQ